MRKIAIALVLSLVLPLAAPVQAGQSTTGFATMERCQRFVDRWERQMDRQRAKGWDGVADLLYSAYCEERGGRFFIVYAS